MSVPPDILAQILQGGLLGAGQQPDQGLLGPALAPYGGANNLGAALLANSGNGGRFGTILGQAMLGSQNAAQKNAQNQLNLVGSAQDLQMKALQQRMFMQAYPAWLQGLTGGQGSPQQGAPANDSGAPSNGPAAPQSGQQGPPAQSGGPASQDPMAMLQQGLIGAALGMPGAKEMIDVAKTRLQYDPDLATKLKAAESTIAQDQEMISQAMKSGNTAMALGLGQKLRQDLGLLHIASMSGTQTRIGLGGDISTFNPNEGVQSVGGVESAIPGAAQARGQIAGAVAMGEAGAKPIEVTDAQGNKYIVPTSAVLGGRVGASGSPAGASGSAASTPSSATTPFQAAIGPQQSEMLKLNAEQAGKANEGYQSQVEAGQQMLANTAELRHSAADFEPGKFAEARAEWLNLLNSADLITDKEKNQLGSAQVGQKIAIQLQAAATKQLGSREAAQIFSIMGKSLPNLTLSPDGLEKVSAYLDGVARYNIARGQLAQQRMGANDAAGVNNVRNEFVSNTNPLYFIMASAAPKQQQEMINALGPKKEAFLTKWNAAANAGWAPRPGQYGGSDGGT